jgi:hypothetical protein
MLNNNLNSMELSWSVIDDVSFYLVMVLDINGSVILADNCSKNTYKLDPNSLHQVVSIVVIGIQQTCLIKLKRCKCKIMNNFVKKNKFIDLNINCGEHALLSPYLNHLN